MNQVPTTLSNEVPPLTPNPEIEPISEALPEPIKVEEKLPEQVESIISTPPPEVTKLVDLRDDSESKNDTPLKTKDKITSLADTQEEHFRIQVEKEHQPKKL